MKLWELPGSTKINMTFLLTSALMCMASPDYVPTMALGDSWTNSSVRLSSISS
jgi:hypothetical protein